MTNLFHATADNFQNLVDTKAPVILVDFFPEWCGTCRNLSPVLGRVAEKYEKGMIIKVDVDKNGELCHAEPYKVRGIPNIFFIKNGEVMERRTGPQTLEGISAVIDPLLAN